MDYEYYDPQKDDFYAVSIENSYLITRQYVSGEVIITDIDIDQDIIE